MEDQLAIASARYHINTALTQLKGGKKANINRAITELECARSVLNLLAPHRERQRKGGGAIEGS